MVDLTSLRKNWQKTFSVYYASNTIVLSLRKERNLCFLFTYSELLRTVITFLTVFFSVENIVLPIYLENEYLL